MSYGGLFKLLLGGYIVFEVVVSTLNVEQD